MKIEVGFGKGVQTCEFPDENYAGIVLPNEVEHRTDEQGILQDALQNPIGARPLAEYDLSGKKIALFGSYGWGDGEWMRNWSDEADQAGAIQVADYVICNDAPDEEAAAACERLGSFLK